MCIYYRVYIIFGFVGIEIEYVLNNVEIWQGIEYLVSKFLIDNTPEDIAKFLFEGEGLSKTAIGDYLGEG